MPRLSKKKIEEMAQDAYDLREQAHALYATSDALLAALGVRDVEIEEGILHIEDAFTGNTVFKTVGINRYRMRITE